MKIEVLGWYDHENIGDEAFKLSFPLVLAGHQLTFVEVPTGNADMIVLGGGDVLYPPFTKHLKKFPDVRQRAMSISLTNNSDMEYLTKFEHVYVRDYRSLMLAAGKIGKDRVTYMPDFTFALQPNREAGKETIRKAFERDGHELYNKVIVVVASAYMTFSGPEALGRDFTTWLMVSQIMAAVADGMDASIVFLPFSTKPPWDDRMAGSWIASRCKYYQKNVVMWEPMGVQDTLNVIAAADAVVSSRLHSTIFSTIAEVPFVDITHHVKNKGFIETIDRDDWSIPLWEFSLPRYRELLSKFVSGSPPHPSLVPFVKKFKAMLRNETLI